MGSTISGFGSDTSDVDMCLVSKGNHSDSRFDARTEAMVTLNNLKNFLNSSMSEFYRNSLILKFIQLKLVFIVQVHSKTSRSSMRKFPFCDFEMPRTLLKSTSTIIIVWALGTRIS